MSFRFAASTVLVGALALSSPPRASAEKLGTRLGDASQANTMRVFRYRVGARSLFRPWSAKRNTDWSRGPASDTVTIDTRGINAGTAEGRAALEAARNIIRESESLGSSASSEVAQSFNSEAREVAAQVRSVSWSHTTAARERARSHSFTRSLVARRARGR